MSKLTDQDMWASARGESERDLILRSANSGISISGISPGDTVDPRSTAGNGAVRNTRQEPRPARQEPRALAPGHLHPRRDPPPGV